MQDLSPTPQKSDPRLLLVTSASARGSPCRLGRSVPAVPLPGPFARGPAVSAPPSRTAPAAAPGFPARFPGGRTDNGPALGTDRPFGSPSQGPLLPRTPSSIKIPKFENRIRVHGTVACLPTTYLDRVLSPPTCPRIGPAVWGHPPMNLKLKNSPFRSMDTVISATPAWSQEPATLGADPRTPCSSSFTGGGRGRFLLLDFPLST